MRILVILLFCLMAQASGHAQQIQVQQAPPLKVISSLATYRQQVKKDKDLQLIEIKKAIPSIVLDIRYATNNNFMQQQMYAQARAFARKPVVEALKKVQDVLKKQKLGLKIYDGYRPYTITKAFYKKASNKNFVANPAKGSRHNRGCAIDLTLIDLKTGHELAMPTPYDSFSAQASPAYANLPITVKKNRAILIDVMQQYGFTVMKNEWWHFDFNGWQRFDLLDIPFEKI